MITNRNRISFECGEGWHPFINAVLDEIEEHIVGDIEITQIKEKYGTLRIYYDYLGDSYNNDNEDCLEFINTCETLSGHICEECGEFYTSKTRERSGWYKTLCDTCAKKENWRD